MATTYEPIASQTLGSDTANIEFTSIPGTYTDLVLVLTGRTSRTTDAFEAVGMRFNSDSGSNYSLTYLLGSGAATASNRASNITNVEFARFNPSVSGNTSPAIAVAQIMSYASTSVFKTVLGSGAASAEAYPVSRYVGLWRSTAAITSIRLQTGLGPNFVSGATASLYGIKAAV